MNAKYRIVKRTKNLIIHDKISKMHKETLYFLQQKTSFWWQDVIVAFLSISLWSPLYWHNESDAIDYLNKIKLANKNDKQSMILMAIDYVVLAIFMIFILLVIGNASGWW